MTTSNSNESFDSEFASTTLSPSKGTTYQTKNTSNTLTSLSCGKDGQDSIDSEYSRHFNIANAKSSEDFATRADEIAVDNFNTIRSNNESTRGRVLAFSTLRSITKRVARGRSLNVRSLSIGRRHNKEEDAEYLINYFNRLNQRGENDSANSPRARKEVIEMNTDCKMTLSDPRNSKSSSSAIGFNESHLLESTTPEKYSKARISHKSEPRPSTTRSTAAPNLKVTSNQGSGNYFSSNKQKASSYHLSTRLRSEGLVSGKNYAMEHDEAISKRTSYVEKSTQRHKITRSKGLVCTDPAQLAETPTPRGTAIDCSRNPLSSQVIKRSEGGFGVTKASGQNHLNDRYKNVTTRGRDAVGETNTKRVNESRGRASSGDAICVSRRNLQEMSGHAPSRGKKQRELSQSIDRNDSSRLRAQSTRSFKASKKGKNQQASYTFLKQGKQKAPGEVDPFSAGILHSKEMTSAKKESFANNTWSAHVRNIDHDGPLPHAIINYNYYIQNQTNHYRPKRDMTLYQGQEQQAIHNFPMPKQMDWPPNPPNTDERDMYFVHRNANNVEENIKSSSSSSGNTSESSPMKNARCAVCHKVLHSGEYVEYCNIYFCKKSDDGARGTCFQCAFCHRSMDELLLNQEAGDEKNAILKWTKVISNARGSVIKCGQCAMGLAFPSTLTSAPYNKLSSGGKGAFTSELIVHRIGEVNETYHRGRHGFRTHRVHYFRSQSAPHALPLPSHNDKSDDDSSDSSDDEVQSRQEELQVHKIENQRKLHSISNPRPNHTTSTTRGSDITIVASKIKNRSELEHEMHSLRSQNKRLEEANSNLELKNKQLSVAVTQLSTVASTSKRMESELIQQVASFVSQTKALTFEYHRTMEILTQKEMELSFLRQNAQLDRNNMGGRVNASYDDAHSNQIGQSTFRDEFRLSNISKCYAENTVSFTNNGVRKSVLDEKGHTIHLNESVAPPAELDPTDSIEHRNALARSA